MHGCFPCEWASRETASKMGHGLDCSNCLVLRHNIEVYHCLDTTYEMLNVALYGITIDTVSLVGGKISENVIRLAESIRDRPMADKYAVVPGAPMLASRPA